MANLITKHDPYHLHKILGLFVLINYIYRFFLAFHYGTAFPKDEPLWISTLSVVLHGALSWSSLLLPLPSTRNFNSPMIWPEFRLHSIAFGTRHVITTVLSLNNLWPQNLWLHALTRAVIVVGTIQVASIITKKWGCREKRTTNAMPYPKSVTPEQEQEVKSGYTRAQFSATKACQLPDATMNFAPLLGIQMAPLLMTLVRKGKATSYTYHRVYSASLFLGYVMVFIRMIMEPHLAVVAFAVMSLPTSKIRKYTSPVVLGVVQVFFSMIVCPLLINPFLEMFISDANQDLISRLALIAAVVTCARQCEYYRPLFMATESSASKQLSMSNDAGGLSFTSGIGNAAEFVFPLAAILYVGAPKLMSMLQEYSEHGLQTEL